MELARLSRNVRRSLAILWRALAAPAPPARSTGEPEQSPVAPPVPVDEQTGDSYLGYVD